MSTTQQRAFVRKLAEFLVENQAMKSMALQAGNEAAKEWARLRNTTPLFGSPSVEEAEKQLLEFLFNEKPE